MNFVVVQNSVILSQAVPVMHDLVMFYKMADCCRPEVANVDISGPNMASVKVNIVAKFDGPS